MCVSQSIIERSMLIGLRTIGCPAVKGQNNIQTHVSVTDQVLVIIQQRARVRKFEQVIFVFLDVNPDAFEPIECEISVSAIVYSV